MDITVFLGAPGSGKGTQAKLLVESLKFLHLSTGDVLRNAIAANSPLGREAKSFMDRGELVPDRTMIGLLVDTLHQLPSVNGVVLDGFPRTQPQAEALDTEPSAKVSKAVYFEVPQRDLIARLTGRRICKNCGESFHEVLLPPKIAGRCDKCSGELIQRPDDSDAVVQRRLEIFFEQNDKLVEHYERTNRLIRLDALGSVDVIHQTLSRLLQS